MLVSKLDAPKVRPDAEGGTCAEGLLVYLEVNIELVRADAWMCDGVRSSCVLRGPPRPSGMCLMPAMHQPNQARRALR